MLTDIFGNLNSLFLEYGYWGLFVACLGLFPAEPLMALLGAARPDQLIQIGVISGLGEMFGAFITYGVGMLFKEDKLLELINRNGLFMNISEKGYLKSKNDVVKKGSLFLCVSRFIPWLRIATAVAAGFLRFNFIKFSLAVFVGTFGYAFLFALAGSKMHNGWDIVFGTIDRFNDVLLILIAVFVVYKIWSVYKKTKKANP